VPIVVTHKRETNMSNEQKRERIKILETRMNSFTSNAPLRFKAAVTAEIRQLEKELAA